MDAASMACLRGRTPLLAAVIGILLFPALAPARERLGFIDIVAHSAGPDLAVRRTFLYEATPAPAVFESAIDAIFGARKINRERLLQSESAGPSSVGLTLLPAEPVPFGRPGDVRLLELRFK